MAKHDEQKAAPAARESRWSLHRRVATDRGRCASGDWSYTLVVFDRDRDAWRRYTITFDRPRATFLPSPWLDKAKLLPNWPAIKAAILADVLPRRRRPPRPHQKRPCRREPRAAAISDCAAPRARAKLAELAATASIGQVRQALELLEHRGVT